MTLTKEEIELLYWMLTTYESDVTKDLQTAKSLFEKVKKARKQAIQNHHI